MRTVNSEVIIDLIKRRFRPIDFNWESDAIDIIGDAISYIGIRDSLELAWKTLTVANHRVRAPQGCEEIDFIIYRGEKLRKSSDKVALNPTATIEEVGTDTKAIEELESLTQRYELLEQMIADTTDVDEATRLQEKQQEVLDEMLLVNRVIQDNPIAVVNGTEYWAEQGHWISTSFPSGDITLYYRRYFLDENDYPMILDFYEYRQAVYFHFASEMIAMGYENKVMSYEDSLNLAELWKKKAENMYKAPTPETMDRLTKLTVRMKFNPNLGVSNFKGA